MKKFVLLLLLLFNYSLSRSQTAAQVYIETYKDLAVAQMNEFGVPASVTLAIAMHESANGTSKLARHLNNHFGIKGKNHVETIRSAYKSYDSVAHSYRDFIRILQTHPSFSKLFSRYTSYDYKNWVRGIQRGGYAHSKTWGSQVLSFIYKYKLYQYDNRPAELIETADTLNVLSQVRVLKIYTVKRGDTLSGIAKRLGTSVKWLMKTNKLKSSAIKPGQKLRY